MARKRPHPSSFPELPRSLLVFFDGPQTHGTRSSSRQNLSMPTTAQSYLMSLTLGDQLRRVDVDLHSEKRSKKALRHLQSALEYSVVQQSAARTIQTLFRHYTQRVRGMSARKIAFWFYKLIAEWKDRLRKAELCCERFKQRHMVKVLQKWHVWAYQSREVNKRVAKMFASLVEKMFFAWHAWTVDFVQRRQEFVDRRRKRCQRRVYRALKEHAQKQVRIKHFMLKIMMGAKRRWKLRWSHFVRIRTRARTIQCAFRCYVARRALFRRRRWKIGKDACDRAVRIAQHQVKRWLMSQAARCIQRMVRGYLGRVSAALRWHRLQETERQRCQTERAAIVDAGRSAAKLCWRRLHMLHSRSGRKMYPALFARLKELRKEARVLLDSPAHENDLRSGAAAKVGKLSPAARRYDSARHAFRLFDVAQIGRLPSDFVPLLLKETKMALSVEEQSTLHRVLPRPDGFVYMSDFRLWAKKGEIHSSLTASDDHKTHLSGTLSLTAEWVRPLEMAARSFQRHATGKHVDDLAARMLILESQCNAQADARAAFRVCYDPPFTCPRCHRDFLTSAHLLEHWDVHTYQKVRGLTAEHVAGLTGPRSECVPRTMEELFRMNFGVSLVSDLILNLNKKED